ncbi:MAG: AsmA family protein, partial [Deferribacteres bacterium]|nr:AsmA family protein [Deferribacteres bacterium]
MRTLFKMLAVLVFLAVVAVIALNFIVKSYLKEERIKALVIPKVEEALGRKVDIEKVGVSLFKGVILKGFVIKEQDGKTDFLRVGEFVLKYKLLPLLKKQIVISEIRIDSPYVRIYRDASGKFNYETLRILNRKDSEEAGQKSAAKGEAFPFSLTVEKVEVNNARLVVRDALKEIPDTDARADAQVTLSMGEGGSLIFKGRSSFTAQLLYGIKVLLDGKVSFTNTAVNYLVNADVEGEKVTLSGDVSDYMKKPSVVLNVSSPFINLAKLKEISAKLPRGKESSSSKSKKPAKKASSEIPVALKGTVKIAKLAYDKVVAENFKADYAFENGVFSLKKLVLSLFGGSIEGTTLFNLYRETYQGRLNVKDLDLGKLLPALLASKSYLTGLSYMSLSWRGAGLSWDVIKRTITADGVFAVRDGRFVNVEMVDAVLSLLGLDELKNLSF